MKRITAARPLVFAIKSHVSRTTLRFLEVPGKQMTGVVSPEELKDADVYILMGKRRIDKSSLEGPTKPE